MKIQNQNNANFSQVQNDFGNSKTKNDEQQTGTIDNNSSIMNFSQDLQKNISSLVQGLINNILTMIEQMFSGENISIAEALETAKNEASDATKENTEIEKTPEKDDDSELSYGERMLETRKSGNEIFYGNYKSAKVEELVKIDDSNKKDFKDKYLGGESEQFDKYYEKYDAQYVVLESGRELLRFVDNQGRPVMDMSCGYIYDSREEFVKVSYYEYNKDGSYSVKAPTNNYMLDQVTQFDENDLDTNGNKKRFVDSGARARYIN